MRVSIPSVFNGTTDGTSSSANTRSWDQPIHRQRRGAYLSIGRRLGAFTPTFRMRFKTPSRTR